MTIRVCVSKINQSVCCPMVNNAGIHAVLTVSTRRVTYSTVVVCMAVKRENNVMKVYLTDFDLFTKDVHFLIKCTILSNIGFSLYWLYLTIQIILNNLLLIVFAFFNMFLQTLTIIQKQLLHQTMYLYLEPRLAHA